MSTNDDGQTPAQPEPVWQAEPLDGRRELNPRFDGSAPFPPAADSVPADEAPAEEGGEEDDIAGGRLTLV
jgi:hypothetical protein